MSESISLAHEGTSSVVTFNLPPFNLLDVEIMDELVAVHQQADAHPDTRVIVTRSGLDGMFCNGLNPLTVVEADTAGRVEIFKAVARLIAGLYSLEKPHIAVLNGPAMAGGAVLAILADFRYMDADRGAMCFAEAKVGVPVPEGLAAVIGGVCLPSAMRDVVMLGKNFDPQSALAVGLVDGLASAGELDAMVNKQVLRLSRLSLDVVKECKASLRAPILPRARNILAPVASGKSFTHFVGDEYLGEGLRAFLEGRPPVFVK
ncbi:MAG TPA: enoyl-CoA hydratase/isomerase family protein [Candidatus Hydrogenedentes bacterium]|nr:enoyl-CoA hydratase/isomerase family protein [Candidatus Hydrogenedentota bacterium]